MIEESEKKVEELKTGGGGVVILRCFSFSLIEIYGIIFYQIRTGEGVDPLPRCRRTRSVS